MKNSLTFLIILVFSFKANSQPCGVVQNLSQIQQTQINSLLSSLDNVLNDENLFLIDSISNELKNVFSTQGGLPDAVETFYTLNSNISWIELENALLLSRELIASDSLVYANLWKTAKGMKPPSYLANSLFLRSSAEIASGLLKIAEKETDLTRKLLYQSWAVRTFDSLATMQIQSGPCMGAFPFPDLRIYNDPEFSPIIENFMLFCGEDSINVLQNGWIIDDKETGEFKFDAGVIANAYYEAFQYTGNINYKNIVLSIGNYLKQLKFNLNYNYNTFVSLGLTRAYQLSNDTSYLNRAIVNLRYAVFPGQIENGRWVDGHNANSRYHSIIIQNIIPTIQIIPLTNSYKSVLENMTHKAVKNMLDYSTVCNSATGYRWLLKAYNLNSSIISDFLRDSISNLIGKHINQSFENGKYLDVPTMGEYLELLDVLSSVDEIENSKNLKINIFPNPTNKIININFNILEQDNIDLSIYDNKGQLVQVIDKGKKSKGNYNYQFDFSGNRNGVYFITLCSSYGKTTQKFVLMK
ncbi:MAG: T9SS type A sorting domain-containing protein [Flavobacteriia bacterium]|nr:T9SS type A sorting domain-containing protein [Flavobacteriia bacterium]